MALYIRQGAGNKVEQSCWHVGEKLPNIKGRVVQLTADGDELVALLRGIGYEGPITGERVLHSGGERKHFPVKKSPGAKQVPPYPCEKQDCKVCKASDKEDTIPGNLPAYGGDIKLGINLTGSISILLGNFEKVFAPGSPPWKRIGRMWNAWPTKSARSSTVMPGDEAYNPLYELFLMDTSADEVK